MKHWYGHWAVQEITSSKSAMGLEKVQDINNYSDEISQGS